MSSISKVSTRSSSSSSGFSSTINEHVLTTSNLQTVLNIQQVDINARVVFCGEQDCRLNDLRRMTGAIIDLNVVQDTSCPFEVVNWTISHRQRDVQNFVIRRLNYWMQQTQIFCEMAYADAIFLREKHEKYTRKFPPSTAINFGRRNRTRSLTQTEMTSLNPIRNQIPTTPITSTYKREVPFTGLLGRTLSKLGSDFNGNRKLFNSNTDIRQNDDVASNRRTDSIETSPTKISQLMDVARRTGVLSDTSENELNENRVCFADTVSLSKLAEMLRNNVLKPTSTIRDIDNVIQQSVMNVKSREQIRQMDGKRYWFHRVILDDHIQFPVGISQDASEARRLAYRHMIDVCLNEGGIKMKVLTNNRVKVVKGPKLDDQNDCTHNDLDVNATYISMNDLSCLSSYKVIN